MKNSLKQLLRTPIKAILFFILMAASSVLLISSATLLLRTEQNLDAAESQFFTIATVEQNSDSQPILASRESEWRDQVAYQADKYERLISADELLFENAGYLTQPENRPYYLALLPQFNFSVGKTHSQYIVEFTPLADCVLSAPSRVKIEKFLYNGEVEDDRFKRELLYDAKRTLEEGDVVKLVDFHWSEESPLKAGRRYIANIYWRPDACSGQEDPELFIVQQPPYSTQYGADGTGNPYLAPSAIREGTEFVAVEDRRWYYFCADPDCSFVDEVTEDFYEAGKRGQNWLTWVKAHEEYRNWFFVFPTNSLQNLPAFHKKQIAIRSGREISQEEFDTGAQVCMIAFDFALQNQLRVGDTVTLPLCMSLYGYYPDRDHTYPRISTGSHSYHWGHSPLNADLEIYQPFWEAEYEIVGIYKPLNSDTMTSGATEIARDMFLIPAKSVKASDTDHIVHYGPMNRFTASFQIPNGTVEAFDKAFRQAVPQAERLAITYDDNGYGEIMISLRNTRLSALLLFLVGSAASLVVITILLYFFVVQQKKRTAIERSLGMTKRQCRISLTSGLLVLTLASTAVGSVLSAIAFAGEAAGQNTKQSFLYSTEYSLWAMARAPSVNLDLAAQLATAALYVVIPIALTLLVWLAATLLTNRNLRLEPITLLSSKGE